jgi:hypothetical protein
LKHNQKLKSSQSENIVKESTKDAKQRKRVLRQSKNAAPSVLAKDIAVDETATLPTEFEQSAMHDQGFHRPRVLILCPFRSTAKQIVNTLQDLLGENTSVSGLEKFESEFGYFPEDEEDIAAQVDHHEYLNMREGKRETVKQPTMGHLRSKKPDDWVATFRDNIDDDFKVFS